MVKNKSNIQKVRSLVQFVFFAFMILAFFLHSFKESGLVSFDFGNVHALCPLGGFETFYSYLTKGTYIKKIHASSLVLSGIIVVMALVAGRFFCSWICPFGTLNNYISILGKKIFGKNYVVPTSIDKLLKPLKYVILFVIIYFSWTLGDLIFAEYDPWTAFAHLPGLPESYGETPISFIILGFVLLGALFIESFFCRYLCPLGAIQAILAKVGLVRIERDSHTCIDCGACTKNCPVGLDVAKTNVVDAAECTNCLNCVTDSCPKGISAISIRSIYNRNGAVVTYILAGFLVFYGFYGTAKVTGAWETSANIVKVAAEGGLTIDSIKGSTEIKDVVELFNLDKEDFYNKLNLPSNYNKHSKCKDVVEHLKANGYPNASMDWIRAAVSDPNFNLDSYSATAPSEN